MFLAQDVVSSSAVYFLELTLLATGTCEILKKLVNESDEELEY